jgi:hypothetical protein
MLSGESCLEFAKTSRDTLVEYGGGFTSRENLDMRVARPVRRSKLVDVGSKGHAINIGAWIVFAKVRPLFEWLSSRCATKRGLDDVCCLGRSWEIAGEQHVGLQLTARAQPLCEPLSLLTTEITQAATRPHAADHAVYRHRRFTVADQRDAGGRGFGRRGHVASVDTPIVVDDDKTFVRVHDNFAARSRNRQFGPKKTTVTDLIAARTDESLVAPSSMGSIPNALLAPPALDAFAAPTPASAAPGLAPPPPPAATAAPALLATPMPELTPMAQTPPVDLTTAPVPVAPAGIVTGPASILSADATFAPLETSMPALPAVAAALPRNTAAAAMPGEKAPLTLEDLLGGQASPHQKVAKKKGGGAKRALRRLVLLGALAAAGYFGYQRGPDVYDQYVSDDATQTSEVDAPKSFPNPIAAPPPIRTAEFVLAGLPGSPDTTYRVTTDFETNVSQVDITRAAGPDLQILTYGNAAMIREAEGAEWYQLERGQFPLDDRLERADWVRLLDELIPLEVRNAVTIDQSTESTIEGVTTRHLTLSLDSGLLGNPADQPDAVDSFAADAVDPLAAPATLDQPPPDQAAAPVPVEASEDLIAAPPAAAPPIDPSLGAVPRRPTDETNIVGTADTTTSIQIWVDAQGLVRQVSGAPQLGADTITVVSTNSAAWVPAYPAPEVVQPLTASALVLLGI